MSLSETLKLEDLENRVRALEKSVEAWRKAASPVTENKQEDDFYKRAEASIIQGSEK